MFLKERLSYISSYSYKLCAVEPKNKSSSCMNSVRQKRLFYLSLSIRSKIGTLLYI